MALDGEASSKKFFLISENQTPESSTLDLPASRLRKCCPGFQLTVFADISSNDTFKNDYHRPIWRFDPSVSTVVLKLFKGAAELATLSGSTTYGTNYDYGYIVNSFGEKMVSYNIEWKKVLTLHGQGIYKVKAFVTPSFGDPFVLEDFEFCLRQYNADLVDGSVKLEYTNRAKIGDKNDDKKVFDYGKQDVKDMIRLPGRFGYPTASYEEDRNRYNNGARKYVKDTQKPLLTLTLKPIHAILHELMRVDVMMSDELLITDYNSTNPLKYNQKAVYKDDGYEPNWKPDASEYASVVVKFNQYYNNLDKSRC